METFAMTINGTSVKAEKSLAVINPATGEAFAECPEGTHQQLNSAVEAAHAALADWQRDENKRRQLMRECAKVIHAHTEELAKLVTTEQGKPYYEALAEVQGAAHFFEINSEREIPRVVVKDDEKTRVEILRKPIGVVGVITPWNFPVSIGATTLAIALLVGDTVVLKPSPFTPLSALKMGELLREILPPGVFNVISGGDQVGRWITEHPLIRQVSFVGAIETGKEIARTAASDLKRLTLGLGSNDPAIVLEDIDPKEIAFSILSSALWNCGQVCLIVKRLYVHEKIYPQMVDELAQLASCIKVGDGLDANTYLGPLANEPQLERVTELVEDARKAGGKIVVGGHRIGDVGYFYSPTIITDVAEGTRVVDEEQFGPVLPVMPFDCIDDVLERANATHFGLGGSVWTHDWQRGLELVSRIQCGIGGVNQHGRFDDNAPRGGTKHSGLGYINGIWGIDGLTEFQSIVVDKALS